jgi:SAM-dependent methyltransferase
MPPPEIALKGRLPEVEIERIWKLFREGERIWARRPDLQAAFPAVHPMDFWFWLMWHGSREEPEVARLMYPEPPTHLMYRVVGQEATPRGFLEGGLVDWRRMHLCLTEGGFEFERGGRVLDFGCGCGRILRFFARYASTCKFSGADVDEGAVDWCRQIFDFATFERLLHRPPSPFPSGHFDAVYAFSVFSHLPETLHRAWLEELFRITRPGAVVVLTIQGRRVIDKMIARGSPSDIPSSAELRRDLPRILKDGLAFYPFRKLTLQNERNQQHFDEWDLEQYGSTFILPHYVHDRWTDLFDVVSLHLAPDDWQDYVVLRRLPRG